MIRFACPVCRSVLAVPEHAVGKKGSCPKCGQRLQIPAPSQNHTLLGISAPKKSTDGATPLVSPVEADWQHSPPIREQVAASRVCPSETPSEQSPAFAPTASRRPWYRLASPTFLIGAIVLFFLPWVDIRCSAANGEKTIASQSGFQMICGGYSLHPALESPAIDQAREMREKLGLEYLSFAPLFAVFLWRFWGRFSVPALCG